MTYWTPDRERHLRQLVDNGRSARQIATEMGDITRNAIIGKCKRLGLALSGDLNSASTSNRRRQIADRVAKVAKPRVAKLPPVPPARPEPLGLTLAQLTGRQCHWPVEEGERAQWFFCGAVSTYRSYCTYHARLAYEPR